MLYIVEAGSWIFLSYSNTQEEHLMTDKKEQKISKPFLRWAGGKSWLIKHLPSIISDTIFRNYHEPFLGGGAVFFALAPAGVKYLSDLNEELIETYSAIRDEKENVINVLKTFSNDNESYYEIRKTVYVDSASKAARFIYLNNTSYNGIYRVNQKGVYNVPYGYRETPFYIEDKLSIASDLLNNAVLSACDFTQGHNNIKEQDLVFLDPPYVVSHNDNGFIKYNQKLFSLEDQERLSGFIDIIKQKGAYYILTNAAHQKIKDIFTKDGDHVIELSRASLIGGENAVRGQVNELIFTNIGGE